MCNSVLCAQAASKMDPPSEDDRNTGSKEKRGDVRHQGLPPPPASWPAGDRVRRNPQTTSQIGIANSLNRTSPSQAALPIAALPCAGFDEQLEVPLPGRRANVFLRIAGRELAASNGVAVLIHGGGFTGMSWAPAAGLMKRDCCVLALDLRGHGLTASVPSRDHPEDDLDGDGKNDLMSLDSLAEDVTSLLVEIFSSGLLLRKPRPHQQEPSPKTEDGRAQCTDATCSPRGSEAAVYRDAAGAAGATAAPAPVEAAGPKVEVHVPQEPVAEEGDDTAATGSGDSSRATGRVALHGDTEKAAAAAATAAGAGATAEAKAEAAGSKVGLHIPQGLVAEKGDDEVVTGSGDANRGTRARDSGKSGGATRLVESPGSMPNEVVDGGGGRGEGGEAGPLVKCSGKAAKEGVHIGGDGGGDTCEGGSGRKIPAGAGSGPGEATLAARIASGEEKAGGSACSKLLLVGHSLGGSIAVKMAGAAVDFKRRCGGTAEIAGVVAVDVVEGTALAALDDMPEILRKIPQSFPSMEAAVLWHSKTGAVRNASSASIVVPSRLKADATGRVVWRTDLRATKRHWRGWFEGMSKAFLALPIPKLLVVAGMDRLDTELTAAHMQGKFQLKLVYGCGHSVQEDQPHETASSIMKFAVRNSVFRIGKGGAAQGGRDGEEEELRRKLARARGQTSRSTGTRR